MQLVINTFGSSIRKNGQMFEILAGKEKHKFSGKKISSFIITTGVHISSDAVELALQNNIDILMLDKYGRPIGRFWHARMGSTARIRRAQLMLSMDPSAMETGLIWVVDKFTWQIEFLEKMRTRRTRLSAEITSAIESLNESLEKVSNLKGTLEERRNEVLGIEGAAGKVYWDIFAKFVPPQFAFKGRSRQPAKDEFNALINYGYGVLYGLVEKAVIVAGLDPYIGFVHTDHYNKISLVFDVIEKYRIWIDQTILKLFSKKLIKKDMFEKLANGYTLAKEGKQALVPAINEYLDETQKYRGRNVSRRDIIQKDLHRFAQQIMEQYDESK